jgi:gluconolactonase
MLSWSEHILILCVTTKVFAPDGTLLGKFFTNMLGANMIFAGPGRLVILAETKVFLAKIAPTTKGVVS